MCDQGPRFNKIIASSKTFLSETYFALLLFLLQVCGSEDYVQWLLVQFDITAFAPAMQILI